MTGSPPPPQRSVDEQLAAYDRRFAPIAEVLTTFAAKENLLIEKYNQKTPMWSLCFGHPQGGYAKLDVIVPADGAVKLLGSWWVDDYDAFTRSLRRGELVPVPMTASRVREALRRYLGSMLGWAPGQWSQVATEYRDIWTRAWPKERFDAAQPRWPKPKGRFLIDLTDDRFKIDENRDVIEYIRRTNPFAHSDIGDLLIRVGQGVPGSEYYCPAMANYAYVVLHTAGSRIFAIAYGMRGLAFRLPESSIADALADGGTAKADIGADWVAFDPWRVDEPTPVMLGRLERWCARAFRHAAAQP